MSEGQGIPGTGLCIMFVSMSMLYAGLLKTVNRITKFPFNSLLLLSGIILGSQKDSLGFVGRAVTLMSELNPNSYLTFFLPPLIFEVAYKMEWNIFKKQCGQAFVLGCPITIIASLLLMLILCLGFEAEELASEPWINAFLLSSILSCTEIFWFLGPLRKFGASQRLIGLMAGQSLFNYCTCVLIFRVVNTALKQNSSLFSLATLLVSQTLGGISLGLLFGYGGLVCIRRTIQDGVLVTTIMTICCYATYMVAEFSDMHFSGMISVVTYGLYMSVFCKARLSGQAGRQFTSFWEYLVFIAQVNVFLLTGILVSINTLGTSLLTQHNLLLVVSLFICTILSRVVSVIAFYRSLSQLGYGMTVREAIVIACSGLQGALGVSFAAIIFQDKFFDSNFRDFVLLITAANSLISITLKGYSTKLFIKLTDISTINKVQYKMYSQFLTNLTGFVHEKKREIQESRSLSMVDWEGVDQLVGLPIIKDTQKDVDSLVDSLQPKQGSKFETRQLFKLERALAPYKNTNSVPINPEQTQAQIAREATTFDTVVEIRKRFVKRLIAKYWELHEQSATAPDALSLLLQSAYFDLDTDIQELESWSWIRNQVSYNIKVLAQIMKISLLSTLAQSYLVDYISFCYDVIIAYIEANEAVRQQFAQMKMLDSEQVCWQLVIAESQENQRQSQSFLNNYLKPSFPEIEREVKTKKASYSIITSFKRQIESVFKSGQLEGTQYEFLKSIAQEQLLTLDLRSAEWEQTNLHEQMACSQLFRTLPKPILTLLTTELAVQTAFDMNQSIIESSDSARHIFFVKKGGCTVQSGSNVVFKGIVQRGGMFGVEALVSPLYRSTVTSITMMVALSVKKVCFLKVLESFPQFAEQFWKSQLYSLLQITKKGLSTGQLPIDSLQFNKAITKMHYVQFGPGEHLINEIDIFLLTGEAEQVTNQGCTPIYSLDHVSSMNPWKLTCLKEVSLLVGQVEDKDSFQFGISRMTYGPRQVI